MNPISLIDKYCSGNKELREILYIHSKKVADMALRLSAKHPELCLDDEFIYEAAMLHDIGIVKTDAPGIHCYGTEHYLMHGLLGGQILREEGLPRHARVAERHTGTGLTPESIIQQQLPLPPLDLRPETMEEQLICYADKFYSKTHLEREKSYEKVRSSLLRFGAEGVDVFERWYNLFGV